MKIKQKWDGSLRKSYTSAYKSAALNFEAYKVDPECMGIKKPSAS